MPYKELILPEDLALGNSLLKAETEQSPLQAVLDNQSPIIKVWFFVMIINLAFFMLLIH